MSRVIFPFEHPVTVVLVDKASGREVHRQDTTAETLSGCLTVLRITWNALSVSGGVRWTHPTTGEWFQRGLSVRCHTTHPDTGEPVEIDPPL